MKSSVILLLVVLFLLVACTAGPATTVPILVANSEQDRPTVSSTATSAPQQGDPASPTPSTPLEAVLTGELPTSSVNSISSTSPDGKWTAEALRVTFSGDAGYYEYELLTIRDYTTTLRWAPQEKWSQGGLGASYISDFYWSADGRYVYFHDTGVADGCSVVFATYLRRVDLTDGSLSEIPLTGLNLGMITLSPDLKMLAYQVRDGFVVRDLLTDETQTIPVKWMEEQEVGWYAWSPDMDQLAFTIDQNPCVPAEGSKSGTSIRILDLDSGDVQTLTDYDPRNLVVIGWDDPKALKVPSNGEEMLLHIDSGALLPDPALVASALLDEYLNSLALGSSGIGPYTYERAADLYSGSYQTLIEMNPEIDPSNHAELLRAACEANGFHCLRLHKVTSARTLFAPDGSYEIQLTVQLQDRSGVVFFTGLCCGYGDAPPQTEFDFTVRQWTDGTFQVLDLPPYTP